MNERGYCTNCRQEHPYVGVGVKLCPLHAAAPDLLEAIKEVLPIDWGIDDTMDHIPGLKKARLAIAKAEGRE